MKALVDDQHWLQDSAVVEKPWRTTNSGRTMFRIGVIEWDGRVMPHPPIRRAIRVAKEKIAAAGHHGRQKLISGAKSLDASSISLTLATSQL